jgi:hypothetical protein
VLLGCARPVHILTPSATVRRIVNMTALCVVDAVSATLRFNISTKRGRLRPFFTHIVAMTVLKM